MQDLVAAFKLRDRIARQHASPLLARLIAASEHHEVRAFLRELQDPASLCDPAYRIGPRRSDFPARVRAVAGRRPWQLVEEVRLTIYRHLLVESPESAEELAPLVGYSHDTLWRVFRRAHAGFTPRRYRAEASGSDHGRHDKGFTADEAWQALRKQLDPSRCRKLRDRIACLYPDRLFDESRCEGLTCHEAERALAGDLELPSGHAIHAELAARYPVNDETSFTAMELCQALRGQLAAERGRGLRDHLGELYPDPPIADEPFHRLPLETRDAGEVARAEAFWEEVRGLAPEEQRERVARSAFRTPALFQVLRTKAREEGRKERKRRVALAELALEALRASRFLMPEALCRNLLAMAWTDLGVARRLMLDLPGAESAFAEAEDLLLGARRDPAVVGLLLHSRAGLRSYQRRFEEGIALEDEALPLLERGEDDRLVAEALLMRGVLRQEAGQPDTATRDVRRAIEIAERIEPESRLTHSARICLARLLLEDGCPEEAEPYVLKADRFFRATGNRADRFHTVTLFGRIEVQRGSHAVAASYFEEARDVLERSVAPLASAFVSVDLASAYVHLCRFSDVDRLLTDSISTFDALKIHREGIAAAALLTRAVRTEVYDLATLDKIRSHLVLMAGDPSVSARLGGGA